MQTIGSMLQAFVTASLRGRVASGAQLSHVEGLALLDLAEAQQAAIRELERSARAYQSMAADYGELAGEWLDLVGILKLAGLEVGQDRAARAEGRQQGGGWYFRIGTYERGGYSDVIAAYHAGLPALLITLVAQGTVPRFAPEVDVDDVLVAARLIAAGAAPGSSGDVPPAAE